MASSFVCQTSRGSLHSQATSAASVTGTALLCHLPAYIVFMASPTVRRYLGVQGRGTIALPADVRRRLHLDQPGAQLEMTERADGVIELRAALPVPAEQRWFWAERWQEREREVDEHVAAGRVAVHESTEEFMDHLDELDVE